jgi:hypothetical protein
LLTLIPVYAIYASAPAAGYFHDDGIYLINAKALVSGQGYRTISLPGAPAQTKYPILYPALLALLWKLFPSFPQNVIWFKLLSLLGVVLWCVALYKVVLQDSAGNGKRLALWIVLLTAASQWTLWISAATLPDSLFCASTVASIYFLTRALSKPNTFWSRDLIAGTCLTSAAFLLRTAGGPLILASAFVLMVRGRFRSLAFFLIVSAVTVGPWIAWQHTQTAPSDPIEAYYTKASYVSGHVFAGFAPNQIALVLVVNAILLLVGCLPFGSQGDNPAMLALAVLTGLIAAAAWLRSIRTGLSILSVWIVVYAAMVVCWLSFPARYEIVLLPFIPLLVWYAVRATPHRLTPWTRTAGKVALTGVLCLEGGFAIRALATTMSSGTPSLAEATPDNWADITRLCDWLRTQSAPQAVTTGHVDPVLYLYSGRQAVRPYATDFSKLFYRTRPGVSPIGTAADFRENLVRHHVTYIVVTPAKWFLESDFFVQRLARLVQQYPKAFSLAYHLPDARYFILRVKLDELAPQYRKASD